jgi:tetratricopeptide (TPR) repeat protein
LAALITDPANIGKINTMKKEARQAYLSGDYKTAIDKYTLLIDSLEVTDEEVKLNLANAYFKANDTTASLQQYQLLSGSKVKPISSRAYQQLGVMNNREGKFEEALNYFKQAIKADPTNDEARYNYEMLKKKLDEQKKQEEQQKDKQENKDKEKQDQKDQEKKDQEKKDQEKKDQEKKDQEKKEQEKKDQEKKDQENKEEKSEEQQQEDKEKEKKEKQDMPPDLEKKLEDMKISPEKARMILEAMKNQEIQYLQQNKRKATKPKDKSKPDW